MKITTKYSIGDEVDLGLYERGKEGEEVVTITGITITGINIPILEGKNKMSVFYWHDGGYFELKEDGKTEAAESELGLIDWE